MFNGTAHSQLQIGDLIKAVKTVKEVNKLNKEQKQQGQNKKNEKNKKNKKGEGKSQSSGTITLIVSADGRTKDEATKTALRSAIEQAYGTFVSANTTILNDELVKDEIVTISNGNIKEYTEIASEQMPDGKMYVTLQATVSISNLVSYAQSKGAEVEFAGATLDMNLKMKELNRQNEIKALENLENQLSGIHNLYDYELEIPNYRLEGLEIIKITPRIENGYVILNGIIHIKYNANTELYNTLLAKTLSSLALSNSELKEYFAMRLDTYSIDISGLGTFFLRSNYFGEYYERYENPKEFSVKDKDEVRCHRLCIDAPKEFIISDNLTSPTQLEYSIRYVDVKPFSYYFKTTYEKLTFENFFEENRKKIYRLVPNKAYHIGKVIGSIGITIKIPQNEVGKYSTFRVEPKSENLKE